jgi:WD40 repeat protein
MQIGDHNKQWNFFAPVALNFFGEFERLQDACFDPTRLVRDLDLDRFTRRDWLIDQIDAFVGDRRRGYVIIRAEAGVGKSTLAAHLVRTRPWLHHFTRLPGGRSPVAARKSLAAQLIRRWDLLDGWAPGGILPGASARPDWFDRVLAAAAVKRDIKEPGCPIVVVVDGLDEADAEASDSGGLPLGLPASLPDGVFVVATSRFGIERALHAVRHPADWLQIEVEGPDNLDDMRRFIGEVTDPVSGDRPLTDALGRSGVDPDWFRVTIAKACAGVWIYLRYVLDEIRDGTMDPRSMSQLPEDLAGYYAEQVQRWRGNPDDEAAQRRWEQVRLPLLGVLAAARAPLTAADLASFAGVLSLEATRTFVIETTRAFLNCSHEGKRKAPSYALRHQSLRDLLSGNVPVGRPDLVDLADTLAIQTRAAHQSIASALVPPGPVLERDWHSAGYYAQQHLAAHAGSDLLNDLLSDPGFLLVTDPDALLARRASLPMPDSKRALEAFNLSLDEKKTLTDAERLARLARNAARVRAMSLAAACAECSGDEWPTRWVAWAGQGHLRLTGNRKYVMAVAVGRAGDRDVVISLSNDDFLRLWDAETGRLLGERQVADAMALGRVGDRDVVISHSFGDSARIWDSVSGGLLGEHTFTSGSVNAVATGCVGDRDVLVAGSGNGIVWVRDAVTRESIQEIQGNSGPVDEVVIGRVGDRDVVAASTEHESVFIWDAVTGDLLGEPMAGGTGGLIAGLGIIRAGDHEVIVIGTSAASASMIKTWRIDVGYPVEDLLAVQEGDMETLTVGRAGAKDIIIAGLNEPDTPPDSESTIRKLRMWDAVTGYPIGKPLTIEGGNVCAMTTGRAGNRDIIVTGSADGNVRVWDASAEALTGHAGGVSAVAVGQVKDQDVVISYSSQDKTARIWDLITGDLIREPRSFKFGWPEPVTLGRVGNRNVIVTVPEGHGNVEIFDVITGHAVGKPVIVEEDVRNVALGRIGDRDVLVTAAVGDMQEGFEDQGIILIRDAVTGELISGPHAVEFGGAYAVAVGRAEDRDVILAGSSAGSVLMFDPVTGDYIRGLRGSGEWVCALAAGRLEDRDVIVAGLGDKEVRIWDAVTSQSLNGPLTGHDSAVTAVAAGHAGNRDFIISGSDDRTVVMREHRLLQARAQSERLIQKPDA